MPQVLINPTHVAYDACPTGYTVRVVSANATVAEYNAGNSPYDSTDVLPVGDRDAIPENILLDYAERTAQEMAEEYGGLPIEHNEDLMAEEREVA